jgi:hypothetical protein
VSHCLAALHRFEAMVQQISIAQLTAVAAVGQGGQQIMEPGTVRTLKMKPSS